jgi:hypothetical protein
MFPSNDKLTICFAHVAYRLQQCFLRLDTGINSFEVRDNAALERRIGEADVLVISGLWRIDLLPSAKRLRIRMHLPVEIASRSLSLGSP